MTAPQKDLPMDPPAELPPPPAQHNVIDLFDEQEEEQASDDAEGPPRPMPNGPSFVQKCLSGGILALLVGLPLLWCFAIHREKGASIVDSIALLCLLPALAVFQWARKKQSAVATTATLFQKFVFGWLVLLPAAVILILIYILVASRLIGDTIAALTAPLVFVALEEVSKLLVTTRKYTHQSVENPKQFVLFSLFSSLGLATGEVYCLSLLLRQVLRWAAHGRSLEAAAFVIIIISCCLILIPMHLLSGYHIGLAVARRNVLNQEVSFTLFMLQPILARFVFLVTVMFLPSILRHITVLLVPPILMCTYIWWVKRYEKQMPRDYLARTGYLTAFGYAALPSGDDDEAPAAAAPNNGPPSL